MCVRVLRRVCARPALGPQHRRPDHVVARLDRHLHRPAGLGHNLVGRADEATEAEPVRAQVPPQPAGRDRADRAADGQQAARGALEQRVGHDAVAARLQQASGHAASARGARARAAFWCGRVRPREALIRWVGPKRRRAERAWSRHAAGRRARAPLAHQDQPPEVVPSLVERVDAGELVVKPISERPEGDDRPRLAAGCVAAACDADACQ
eukprot:5205054-Prymnesium_polylepis.2